GPLDAAAAAQLVVGQAAVVARPALAARLPRLECRLGVVPPDQRGAGSGRDSPVGSTAFPLRCTVRSALVKVPSFSPQVAAGSTTSANSAVSVRKMSCTTTNSSSLARMRRMRASSGSDTAGLVAEIHSSL